MRRLDLPALYLLTDDDTVARRMHNLDKRWQAHRLGSTGELGSLPTGSLVFVDTACAALPAWEDARWRSWCGHLSIIVASSEPHDTEGIRAMEAGAAGYCHTYANEATLLQVLDVVAAGELWVGRSLLTRLLRGVSENLPRRPDQSWRRSLTDREAEVAQLAANGESNLVIAEKLGITERTVKSHLTTVFEKLQLGDRLQLALRVHGVK
ncbi:response regulator transcription factor [Viridibacterium curvum]|uniref:Response regulator transcription factor n=1 Tax=Viridibacterium curvum TaxID=1101404 RepID=A0ABP9Q6G1_9RHOO